MNRYSIYDSNKGIFEEDIIIYAKNSSEAVKQYMKENNITGSIKRSASNYVRFKATKTKEVDGRIYRSGNDVWYLYIA